MASSFLSDFFPEHIVRRFFPTHQAAAATRSVALHLRNIYIVPSRIGLGLICIILLTLVAAINFQNSSIYIVSFWLASLLVVNVFYSYRNLSGLQIELLGPEPCFAGQQCLISLKAEGRGRKESIYAGWKEIDLALIDLSAAETTMLQVAYPAPRRGRLTPPRLEVFTRYPTGLTVAWAYVRLDIQAIVYPVPALIPEHVMPGQRDESAEDGREISGGVSDFSGMRDYQKGDSPRHIHWAKYAQTGKLHTKVFVDYEQNELWLNWADLSIASVERRLSHLCARVLELTEQQQSFGLRLPGRVISPDRGDAHRDACLMALALYPQAA